MLSHGWRVRCVAVRQIFFRFAILALLAGIGLCGESHAADKKTADIDLSKLPPPAKRQVDFVHDIRPIFESHCWKCHGASKHESSLSLNTHDAAFAGGDEGKEFEPGKSNASRLIRYVSGLDTDTVMPPDGEGQRLTAEQVGLLRAWIDQGAKWPKDADASATASNIPWSYHKPVRPAPPQFKSSDKYLVWPKNDILIASYWPDWNAKQLRHRQKRIGRN